jgi:magnesium transporter
LTIDDRLARAFLRAHPAEAARAVEALPAADLFTLFGDVPAADIAPVLARMDQSSAARVLENVDRVCAANLVKALEPSGASLLLRRVPEAIRDELLRHLGERLAARLRELLRFPPDTAGALCDPAVLTVSADCTAADAVEAVRRAGRAYYYVFVVDRDQRVVGVVNLRDLVSAAADTPVRTIARTDVVRLPAAARPSAILAHPAWRDLAALPVVDAQDRFLGLLRHETVRRLESDAANRPMSEAATVLAMELGELFWAAGAEVVSELAGAIEAPGRVRSAGRDDA